METKNLKLVKACVYSNGIIYFPVAFMADPASAEYEYDQYNRVKRVRTLSNGMPCTNGCIIIPMGATPIKGKLKMSLTNFETLLAKFGYHFYCVIPHKGLKNEREVFDAFRWMMYGCNHLPSDKAIESAVLLYQKMFSCSLETAYKGVENIMSR